MGDTGRLRRGEQVTVKLHKENLYKIMKQNNLNASSLAKKINYSRGGLSRILNEHRNPSSKFINGVLEAFPKYDFKYFFILDTVSPNRNTSDKNTVWFKFYLLKKDNR